MPYPVAGQVIGEVVDDLARVVFHAVNERRLAPSQHGQAKRVKPRAADHAALVAKLALRVDHGHVEPLVVGAETSRPHDRTDLAAAQVKPQPRRGRHASRRQALGRAGLLVMPVGPRPVVERVKQAAHLEVRERSRVAQPAGEQRAAVAHGRPAAYQFDAHRGERVQVERCPLRGANELRRWQPPGPGEIVDLVIPLIPHARGVHPPQHVVAPVCSRQPDVLPHRERHRPARPAQFRRQLHASGRRSHHEHPAIGELGRATVVERSDLLDRRRHRVTQRRHDGPVARPARDDHRPAGDRAAGRQHLVPVVSAAHRRDVRVRPDGSTRGRREALDELGYFPGRHVAVGIRAVVTETRQAALPIGREQPQRIPALPPPRVRDPAALKHDVIDRAVAKEMAGRQAGVTRADDDRGDVLDDLVLRRLRR
jgi:hypothetical protein